ncbi:MAG TPA: serine hydrolase domain-containing protein [Candidatus Sumerlaeota bacterium]|nr:serine hydrolase domain-containing protein [Candidatus Sumerlaeota bacterium]
MVLSRMDRRAFLKCAAGLAVTGLGAQSCRARSSFQPLAWAASKAAVQRAMEWPADEARVWRVTGRECPALAGFDRTLQDFMTARKITSASLAVTRASQLVYARGYSWDAPDGIGIRPDTLFRIASVSKPVTAAGVFYLVQQRKLNLSDKLVDLVKMEPLKGEKCDPRLKAITVLHLLQHRGGWDRDRSFDPMFRDREIAKKCRVDYPVGTQHIVRYMAGQPLDFDPGTRHVYSNFGYCLLGRVIEAVSGVSYERFMRETVLSRLDIQRMVLGRTVFEKRQPNEPYYRTSDRRLYPCVVQPGAPETVPEPYGHWNIENMDAHGGWLASAVDLAKFATAFDSTGRYPLLKPEFVDQTFAPPSSDAADSYYGRGWMVRPVGASRSTWHNGSLPGTYSLLVRRHDGLNWVVLFNQRDDPWSRLSYEPIDGLLHQAADSVREWPKDDLFDNYGFQVPRDRDIP